ALAGFFQIGWLPPSRARKQPCTRRWRSKSSRFKRRLVELLPALSRARFAFALPRGAGPIQETRRKERGRPRPRILFSSAAFRGRGRPRSFLESALACSPQPKTRPATCECFFVFRSS